jgi:ribosomal protein S18 acetylase RimI-like enzyme
MKTCYVDMDSRSIIDLVAPGELAPGWTITRINVPKSQRGKGLGSVLLDQVCQQADVDHVDLWLEVRPSDGLDHDQLTKWYRSRGFKMNRSTGYMVRRWK